MPHVILRVGTWKSSFYALGERISPLCRRSNSEESFYNSTLPCYPLFPLHLPRHFEFFSHSSRLFPSLIRRRSSSPFQPPAVLLCSRAELCPKRASLNIIPILARAHIYYNVTLSFFREHHSFLFFVNSFNCYITICSAGTSSPQPHSRGSTFLYLMRTRQELIPFHPFPETGQAASSPSPPHQVFWSGRPGVLLCPTFWPHWSPSYPPLFHRER